MNNLRCTIGDGDKIVIEAILYKKDGSKFTLIHTEVTVPEQKPPITLTLNNLFETLRGKFQDG